MAASQRRRQVLEALRDEARRPMEVGRALGVETGNLARLLFQLERKNLIQCLTPAKRSWRVYAITELGRRVLNDQSLSSIHSGLSLHRDKPHDSSTH
ncbi:MAG: hypothetical protein GC154_20325 [bacterium]|nr:hypothetical protein [bacterium]